EARASRGNVQVRTVAVQHEIEERPPGPVRREIKLPHPCLEVYAPKPVASADGRGNKATVIIDIQQRGARLSIRIGGAITPQPQPEVLDKRGIYSFFAVTFSIC